MRPNRSPDPTRDPSPNPSPNLLTVRPHHCSSPHPVHYSGIELHPLPLLVSEGNGRGGGDYNGNNNELCGTWARDCISVEKNIPDNYTELTCDFYE